MRPSFGFGRHDRPGFGDPRPQFGDQRDSLRDHFSDQRESLRDHLHEHFAQHFGAPEARGGVPFPPMPPGAPWGGGPGGFGGPPFGPGFPGRGRGRGRGRHGGPGRRSRRGDVRAAILKLLVDRPMHGYEMIQEITERSGELWRPSPGSVYPTLQLLADEGLINEEGHGPRKLYALTDEGRAAADLIETPPWEEIARDANPKDLDLREAIGQLMGATMQVGNAATDEQKTRAIDVLNEARRALYAILGEATPPTAEDHDENTDEDSDGDDD